MHELLFCFYCCIDCLFVAHLYFGWDESLSQDKTLVLFSVGVIFIIIPLILNLIQLHYESREWMSDVYCQQFIQAWARSYLHILYMFAILFGSAFAAVEIFNSNIFHLPMFNMGLYKRQRAIFTNQRILSVVLFEDVPHLILQCVYIGLTGTLNYITIVATTFTIISIISSIFSFKPCESITIIEMRVESQQVANMQPKEFQQTIVHHRNPICREFAKIISADSRIIEILMPIQTNKGTKFIFYIGNTDEKKSQIIIQTITNVIDSGELGQVMFFFQFMRHEYSWYCLFISYVCSHKILLVLVLISNII